MSDDQPKAKSTPKEGRNFAYVVIGLVVIAYLATDPARWFLEAVFNTNPEVNPNWLATLGTMATMGFGAIVTVVSGGISKKNSEYPKIRPVCGECPLHEWTSNVDGSN